jgi:hypothetical protein
MKRYTVVLILVVAGMLLIVAPASAVTLHGRWTDGLAVGAGGTWDLDGWILHADSQEPLVASGNVAIETYPTSTDVASLMIVTANPDVPPFPGKFNAQQVFTWGPATQSGDTWTVNGQVKSPTYMKWGLNWTAVVVADTKAKTLTMTITTTGSYWNWHQWELHGQLR